MNTLKELGEAARDCADPDYRALMKDACLDIAQAAIEFYKTMDAGDLVTLNGAWAKGRRLWDERPPNEPTDPLGGDTKPSVFRHYGKQAAA